MIGGQNYMGYVEIKDNLVNALISDLLGEKNTSYVKEFNEVLNQYRKNRAYFLVIKYKGDITLEEKEWIEKEGYKEIYVNEQAFYQFLLEWVDKNLGNYVNYDDVEKWMKIRGYEERNEVERLIRKMDEAISIKKARCELNKKNIEGYEILEQWYGKEEMPEIMHALSLVKVYMEKYLFGVPNLLDAVLELKPFSHYHTYKNTKTGGKITHPKKLKAVNKKDEKIEYWTLIYVPQKKSQSRRLYIVYREIKGNNEKLKKREVLEFIWASHGGNEEISRVYDGTKIVIHEKSTNKTNGYEEVAKCAFY